MDCDGHHEQPECRHAAADGLTLSAWQSRDLDRWSSSLRVQRWPPVVPDLRLVRAEGPDEVDLYPAEIFLRIVKSRFCSGVKSGSISRLSALPK